MAILEDVPGLEVRIYSAGRPLSEFPDPHAHDEDDDAAAAPTSNQYLECVNNTEFVVDIKVHDTYEWGYRNHILVANTHVDGKHVRGSVIRATDLNRGRKVPGREVQSEWGTWNLQRFKFTTVTTIDDAQRERVDQDMKIAKNLGTIEVSFNRAVEHGRGRSPQLTDHRSSSFELAEKSLKGKAVSHGTSYGASEAISTPNWIDARNLPEDNGPIAVFKFLYRSRESLKRELIIPRSPSRSPTLDNLSVAERDRLARERLQELRSKVKSENGGKMIKREFGEVFDLTQDSPPRVKRPTKKSRLEDGRVVDAIDLTDD